MKYIKKISLIASALFLGYSLVAFGADLSVLRGPQGGTNTSSTTAGNIGNCLTVASVNPLVWNIGSCGGASSFTTTTINGVSSLSFTFNSPSSTIRISTSSNTISFDFASPNISQFTNNSGYLTATTSINAVQGPSFTFNVLGNNGLSYSTSSGTISLTQATSSAGQSGFLASGDFITFNGKQNALVFPLPLSSTTQVTILGTTYIGVSTVSGTSTITNNGVQTISAGSNISVSSATGTPVISVITTFATGTITNFLFTNATGTGTFAAGTSTISGRFNINSGGVLQMNGTTRLDNLGQGTLTTTTITALSIGSLTGLLSASNGTIGTALSSSSISLVSSGSNITIGAKDYPLPGCIYAYATSSTIWDDVCGIRFFTTSTLTSLAFVNKYPGDTVTLNIYYSASVNTATTSAFKVFTNNIVLTSTSTGVCYALQVTTTACSTGVISGSSTPRQGDWLRLYVINGSSSETVVTGTYDEQ